MSAKERILLIRLLNKLEQHPAYAKVLGIETAGADRSSKQDREDLTGQ